jgi:hypothetical protein
MGGYFSQKMFGIPKGLALTKRLDVATFAHGLVLVASVNRNKK